MHRFPPLFSTKKGTISGYASYFNVTDQQGDRVVPGAFTKTLQAWKLFNKTPTILWQHDFKVPIGKWRYLSQDSQGLYVEGQLALGVRQADEAYFLLKETIIEGLSIGFRALKTSRCKQTAARLLWDIDLIEISLVTFGANSRALVQRVKGAF